MPINSSNGQSRNQVANYLINHLSNLILYNNKFHSFEDYF